MPVAGEDAIHPVTSNQVAHSNDNVKQAQSKEVDQAAKFLASVGPFPPMTPEQEKVIVRKIDRWMIPLVRIT